MMVVSPCGDGDNGPGRVQGCSDAAFAQDLDVGPLVEGCGWCQRLDVLAFVLNMYRSECRCFVGRTVCTVGSLGRPQWRLFCGAARRGPLGGTNAVCYEVLHGGSFGRSPLPFKVLC